jgi:exosome complex component RRP42
VLWSSPYRMLPNYGSFGSYDLEPLERRVLLSASVADFAINDGHIQRSMVTSLTVEFDSAVTVGENAFELTEQSGAGVNLDVGEAYADSKGKGNLICSSDLLPLASPRFEMGPPKFDGIELPRLIDRMVRESGMIDLSGLAINDEKVWNIYIDIYPLNDDGSLIDAASIAVVAAMHNARFPRITEDMRADHKRTDKKLPLSEETIPVSFTFYKLDDSVVLHPTREEQEACDTKVTFGISKWNGQYMVNSCQKGWETPFTRQEIEKMMDVLPEKYEEVMKKLKNLLG